MILDGRAIADDLYKTLSGRRARISGPVKLGILVVGVNPVIESFVRIKTRAAEKLTVDVERVDLGANVETGAVVVAVQELAARVDSIIVQLPLPQQVDSNTVLAAIPIEKDVDALNPTVPEDRHPVFAPVALAVVELLNRANVNIEAARAVVIGSGRLVGAPTGALLKRLGAQVSFFTLKEGSMADLKDADIVVCGAGNPGFIKPEALKSGVALVDAGASESKGRVVGDADPACAEIASVFTPVPGGVGPVAVAKIFENLFHLVESAGK